MFGGGGVGGTLLLRWGGGGGGGDLFPVLKNKVKNLHSSPALL